MRVGLVCPYSLDVPGGVQNHVLGLAHALRQRGHEVSVLAPGDAPGVVSLGRALPLPYKGATGRVSFGPVTATRVGRWLDEGKFDIVHVHEPLTPSASLLAVRAAEVPVVATFHIAQERPRALVASANLLRPLLGRIDAHVAVSETAARTVRRYLPVQLEVIPNGLDTRSYDGDRVRDGRTVLFLGRIDERRKGLQPLLEAWPTIGEHRPTARLLVAGPGRAPAVPRNVEVLGELTEPAKRQALRDADLVVAPNTHGESFGLVLVEAMAAGTPVLAHGLRAFRDVLGDGRFGALYTDDLAAKAAALLADPVGRDRLATAARTEVARYDWDVVAPDVEAVYLDLLEGDEATAV